MKKDNSDIILNKSLYQAILLVSLPLMLNGFIYASYNFIDSVFVAQIGSLELAAVALIGPLYNVIAAISIALSITGTTIIGRCVGEKNEADMKDYIAHLSIIVFVISLVVLFVGFTFSHQILKMASATEGILNIGGTYFRILIGTIPFMFFNSIYIAYKSGIGETKRVMQLQFFSMTIKVVFNYIMVIILKQGIVALAFGTLLGHIGITVIILIETRHLRQLKYKFKLSFNKLKEISFISLPIIIERTSMSFSFVMINAYVLEYGEVVLAAYGITNRINSLFFSTVAGLGSGLATIISQNYGAKQWDRIEEGYKKSQLVGFIFAVVFGSGIVLFRHQFASVFDSGDAILHMHVTQAVAVYSISIIPWAMFQVIIGTFTGLGLTKYNLYITFMRLYIFRLPLIAIMTRFERFQTYSIWIAMLMSNIFTAIFAIILFRYKGKTIIKGHLKWNK